MNIIFFGTPDFAIPSLNKLLNSSHKITAVVTAPDKERGRGQKVSFTPIKKFALEHNLPFLQPDNLLDEIFYEKLISYKVDLFVVVAFRILPEKIFCYPKYGSFNLHASLLPKYRGAAPIQWVLLNGDTETGVTTFKLEKKVDTGNLYLQKKIEISGSDNFESLHDKLSILGSEAVIETVNLIAKNQYVLIKQNESESSPAPKISKEITQLNWNESVIKNFNKIRAFSPIPGAFFTNEGKIYKVYSSLLSNEIQIKQGEYFQNKSKLFVGCSDGTLEITEIQPEGKRVMKSEEFVRGYKLF